MSQALSLGQYQDEFARLLLVETPQAEGSVLAALARQPGFAVYRNTVLKGCIDALQANYPAVCRLVGEEWFRAAAAVYARAHPPAHPALLFYGEDFAAFLAGFAPAADLPYLPAVAVLDRCWTEAHVAADAPVTDAASLAQLPPEALAGGVLTPHPAARWRWFDDVPAFTIWNRNRAEDAQAEPGEIDWRAEGALLTRTGGTVTWRAASRADCAFLDACAAGRTVAQAAGDVLACEPQADLTALIGGLLGSGAFSGLATASQDTSSHASTSFSETYA